MKKHIALLMAGGTLALAGCSTSHHATKWEYKTIISKNKDITPLDPPEKGYEDKDGVVNAQVKDGWTVAGYGVDQVGEQWFLLKRPKP